MATKMMINPMGYMHPDFEIGQVLVYKGKGKIKDCERIITILDNNFSDDSYLIQRQGNKRRLRWTFQYVEEYYEASTASALKAIRKQYK